MKKSMRMLIMMFVMTVMICTKGIEAKAYGITQTAQTQNAVTFKWDADYETSGYKIYIVDVDKDVDIDTIAPVAQLPATATSYTATNLKPGTKYEVKVRYGDNTWNSYSSRDIRTLPGKVTGVNQTKWWYFIESVDFGWDKQSGVDGYYVIMKDNKGKVVLNEKQSFNSASKSVKNTKVYTATVQAYSVINGVTYKGEVSNPAYLYTQPMVNESKTKVSGNKMTIAWNKVDGVTGYDVYVSTKEKSGYKKVKSLKASKKSCTITKLKGKKISSKKKYFVYIVGKKKVGKITYTSGRLYSMMVKGRSTSLRWSFSNN